MIKAGEKTFQAYHVTTEKETAGYLQSLHGGQWNPCDTVTVQFELQENGKYAYWIEAETPFQKLAARAKKVTYVKPKNTQKRGNFIIVNLGLAGGKQIIELD